MTGPSPKSYCNHNPGSVTHGRCTRAFPSRYCFLTCATARRDDRSDPVNPIATSLSWATSARILPFDCSTHSSIFGRNSSTNRGRHVRGGAPPASRSATSRATVWCEHPARSAAACNEPSQIERSEYFHGFLGRLQVVPPGGSSGASAPPSGLQEGPQPRDAAGTDKGVSGQPPKLRLGSFVATSGQKPWPSAGCFVAAYGQFFMAADIAFIPGNWEGGDARAIARRTSGGVCRITSSGRIREAT